MQTQMIDGVTYSKIDEQTYVDERGGEWVLWERGDMQAKIREADKVMARLAGRLEDFDAAAEYSEQLEIKAESEEDLRIIEELWDL